MDRHIEIAEHLWLILEAMARDMGTDPRSLVNQAVFNWARRNGYPVISMALAAMDTPLTNAPPPPKPVPVADEATRAIDPDSPAAAILRPRDPNDETSAARSAVAARIVAIDRALEAVLPAPGRATRTRMSSTELAHMSGERSVPIVDTSPNQVPRFTLELRVEGTSDTIIVDDAPVIIGRAKHCTLVIESPQVSREHAVITKEGTSYILADNGSSNGTFVGDQQIERHELRDGELCRIGSATILVAIRVST